MPEEKKEKKQKVPMQIAALYKREKEAGVTTLSMAAWLSENYPGKYN